MLVKQRHRTGNSQANGHVKILSCAAKSCPPEKPINDPRRRRHPIHRRVTCPVCGAPLSDTNERPDGRETLRDTSPFGHLWPEALAGEAIVERFLRGNCSFESSPIALMRALLVQTWRPFAANGRDPAIRWVIGPAE